MLCKQIECYGTVYTLESFPLHIIIHWNNRTNVIMLEYDYNKKRFIDSTIYKTYCYHDHCYDRRKPCNYNRYMRLKAAIPYKVYQEALKYIFD